jgi:clan AA aspartic protease (TIGR02281 family)
MKLWRLTPFPLILLASAAIAQSNLPQCSADSGRRLWDNCQGNFIQSSDNSKYVSEFHNGRPNGQGTRTWPNGTEYTGQFLDGNMWGQGTLTWPNGDKYVGEFHGGKMDGTGTFAWANGQKYIGKFIAGAISGQGTMFAADGSVVSLATTTPTISPAEKQETSPVERQESPSAEEVLLKKNGAIFVVPVEINGAVTLDFAVDSGASTVTIPANVYDTLVRNGTISDSDMIGQGTVILADGSKSKLSVFTIRSLKVGGKTINNVIAAVLPSGGQSLLGQSFLARFKSWSLDNSKHVLLLNSQ